MRASLILGALLALDAGGHMVRADAGPAGAAPVHLQWSRPVGSTCIGQAALAQRVEALLGRHVFAYEGGAGLRIAGNVAQRGESWIATLYVEEGSAKHTKSYGVRRLEQVGGDCAALSPALTVVLATLVDLAQSDARAQGVRIDIGVAGGVDFGVLPEPAPGGSLQLGVRPSAAWSLWIDASAWLPVETRDTELHGAVFDAWRAGLSLCRDFQVSERLALSGCAGGQLGVIDGEGRGLDANRSSQRLLAQSGLAAVLSLKLFSAVALRTSATGEVFLARPTFFWVEPDETHHTLFRPPALGLSLRAGITVEIR